MIKILKRYHLTALLAMMFVMLASASVFAAADEYEPNNVKENANSIQMGSVVYGVTDDYDFNGSETGFDWFVFRAPVNGTAKIAIHADYLPLNFTSAELNVYDSSGNQITRAYDDKSQYGGKAVQFGVTSGNKYYIRVCCDYAGYCSPDAEYNFKVSYFIGKTAVTSKKGSKRAFTVKWNRKTNASYYQVQYTKKSRYNVYGWNGARKVKAAGNSKKIRRLARNTKYCVRVRVVRKINGATYYSAWSKKKVVKTK